MGFNHAEAKAYAAFKQADDGDTKLAPRAFPMQALDHAAGYLLAFGINAALCKTITVCFFLISRGRAVISHWD